MSPREPAGRAMQQWFVYYKLDAAAAREAEPSVRRMQAQIARRSGVRPRLMRRCDDAGPLVTLMEVYEGIAQPQEFERLLADAVLDAGLPAAAATQRRAERFEEL